ncbi:hypothetical protein ACSAZK_09430 [Methanosarcina sp. Mfa9]|uniref:hypothetical protein n=1 Tax=Methanosarcina sp. Mfa9 TaxID=3439063 RepID=UPI003F841535
MDDIVELSIPIKYESGKDYSITVQHIPSSNTYIISYKGEFKTGFFRKKFAPYLLSKFGERSVLIAGKAYPFLEVMGIFLSSVLSMRLVSLLPDIPFSLGFLFVLIWSFCYLPFYFKYQSSEVSECLHDVQCKRCGRKFACDESRIPDFREISSPVSYSIEITRYWKCRYCGSEDARTGSEGLLAEKGDGIGSFWLNRIKCAGCGRKRAYEEFKKEDKLTKKHFMGETITFTRYFRCRFCGYEVIERLESSSNFSDIAG